MELKHDIFLCHNFADKDWVKELGGRIESEEHEGKNLKAFFDEWDIEPGKNIVNELEKALQESRYVGVVLSKKMLEAEWPKLEWTIAVYNDPSGKKGTVIPIWLGNCEIPPSLKIRNVLYFNNEHESKKSYKKLLALLKNQKLPRSEFFHKRTDLNGVKTSEQFPIEYADEIEEQIASNLLPVIHIPKYIWSGPVPSGTTYTNIFDHINRKIKGIKPTFLLRGSRIYSFWGLNDKSCPFRELLIADSIEKMEITPWKNNLDKKNGLIELLNRAFRNHCYYLGLKFDKKHRRFFFLPYGGQNRTITWHTGTRKSTRTVVKKCVKGKSDKEFWAHQSIQAEFENLDGEIFLKLVPGWAFTSDGENSIPPKEIGPLSTKWTHNEYNSSVFYHIRFWCNVLSEKTSKITLKLGDSNAEIDVSPSTSEITVGIEGDQFTIEKVFEVAEEDTVEDFGFEKTEDWGEN